MKARLITIAALAAAALSVAGPAAADTYRPGDVKRDVRQADAMRPNPLIHRSYGIEASWVSATWVSGSKAWDAKVWGKRPASTKAWSIKPWSARAGADVL
jgi:hypothetical protein